MEIFRGEKHRLETLWGLEIPVSEPSRQSETECHDFSLSILSYNTGKIITETDKVFQEIFKDVRKN